MTKEFSGYRLLKYTPNTMICSEFTMPRSNYIALAMNREMIVLAPIKDFTPCSKADAIFVVVSSLT